MKGLVLFLSVVGGLIAEPFLISSGEVAVDGVIQSPVDWSHLTSRRESRAPLPSSFDSRDSGWVTPAKDQGSCGGCWSFSTMGMLETQILKGESVATNFSELHLLEALTYDYDQCLGGTIEMAVAYLTAGLGPVLEEQYDPYEYAEPAQTPATPVTSRYVETMVRFPSRTSSVDNDLLKQAVLDYGAVFINFYADSVKYFDEVTGTYYCDSVDTALYSNHAVLLIGWDDTITTAASTPGAFLIKNSGGPTWNGDGTLWISYEDVRLGYEVNAVFKDIVEKTNYSNIYYHDTLGHTSQLGLVAGMDSAWGAAVFTAVEDDSIGAVGTYFLQQGSSYDITIYREVNRMGPNTTFGSAVATASGSVAEAGYYTIPLSDTVAVPQGETFVVVIKYKTPGYDGPLPIEHAYPGYASGAVAAAGECYYSGDGVAYVDLTDAVPSGSFTIKALGISTVNVPVQLLVNNEVTVNEGSSVLLGQSNLYAVGPEESAAEISYTVTTTPSNGHLENSDNPSVAITAFTQADIDAEKILYVDDSAKLSMDSLVFAVSDGVNPAVEDTLYITVNPNNTAPILTSSYDTVWYFDGDSVSLDFTALDSDADDTLRFSVDGPEGMIIDTVAGRLLWLVENAEQFQYWDVVVTVSDDSGATDRDSFVIYSEIPAAIESVDAPWKSGSDIVAYPNPVSLQAPYIRIALPEDFTGEVTCIIFDVAGHRMDYQRLMVDKPTELRWDLRNKQGQRVHSGAYLVMIQMVDAMGHVRGETLNIGVQK